MKTIRKNNLNILLSLGVAAIVALSCSDRSGSTQANIAGDLATDVQPFVLKDGQISAPMIIPGQLVPYNSVELYTKENGFVKNIYVDIGSSVKKGQTLVILDAPEMISEYNQAQADMNTKLSIYKGSRSNFTRLLRTSKTPGTISPNDLDQAYAKASADSAQWVAAQSHFRQTADLLGYLSIKAPFDGVVTARNVSPGAYIEPGDKSLNRPLLVVEDRNRLRLTMNIAEDYVDYFTNRDTVSFSVRAFPGRTFVAKISRMSGGIDPQTRTEKIEMDVDNSKHVLLPQMYADIALQIKGNDHGFAIPRTALLISAERTFVIVVRNKKAVWVDVQKGIDDGKSVTVTGALHVGDILVTNATDEIKQGALLNIVSR